MTPILEKLYYGEISPCSLPTPTTEKYLKVKEEVGQYEKELLLKYRGRLFLRLKDKSD